MSVLLGVIFFMLIQVGLKHGWKHGITIAFGVITGDILFVVLAIGFTAYISAFLKTQEHTASIIGGLVLLVMGLTTIFKKRNTAPETELSGMRKARDFYLKPFIINLLNPANAAWWLGLYSMPPAVNYNLQQKIVFAFGAVLTVFFTEVGIAATASRLKSYITPKILKNVDYAAGLVLLAFGIKLVWSGLQA
ncbi:MAG: LysE family transporter [Bacteroidia bacterium]|nr:LysE family transporter [Bacteroidia bacterium]